MKGRITAVPCLRLRKKPWGDILDCIPFDEIVEILDDSGAFWWKVRWNGLEGYSYNRYIEVIPDDGDEIEYARGVDLSKYNPVNFGQFKLPDFVSIRATLGDLYIDSEFGKRMVIFRSYYHKFGKPVLGFYHVFHYWKDNVKSQFEFFKRLVSPNKDEFVAVDFEIIHGVPKTSKELVAERLKVFLGYLENEFGLNRILLYTSKHSWDTLIGTAGDSEFFKRFNLWIAHYGVKYPTLPSPWKDWTVWQYTSRGKWPGVLSNVDRNHVRWEFLEGIRGDL